MVPAGAKQYLRYGGNPQEGGRHSTWCSREGILEEGVGP